MSRRSHTRRTTAALVVAAALLSACSSEDPGPKIGLGVPSSAPSTSASAAPSCPPPPPLPSGAPAASPAAAAAPVPSQVSGAPLPSLDPACATAVPTPSISASASPSPSIAPGAFYPDNRVVAGQPARFVLRIKGDSAEEVAKIVERLLGQLKQSYVGYGYRPAGQPRPAAGQKDTFTVELSPEVGTDLAVAGGGVKEVEELLLRLGEVKAGPYRAIRLEVKGQRTALPGQEYRFGDRGTTSLPHCNWRTAANFGTRVVYVCDENQLAPGQARLTPAQIADASRAAATYAYTVPANVTQQRY